MAFSVLIAVYSGDKPEYFDQALASIANQSRQADQVVLVEDGPLGLELDKIVAHWRKIVPMDVVTLPKNLGLAAALNAGLSACRFDLILRADSDDVSKPSRFEKQVAFMESHPEIGLSSGVIEEVGESGEILQQRDLPLEHTELVRFGRHRSPISHPACAFRRVAVEAVGGYPSLYPEDYLLWARMIVAGVKLANMPEVLVEMRVRNNFFSRRGLRFLRGEIRVFWEMRRLGYIGLPTFVRNVIARAGLRLAPPSLKAILYRQLR